MSKEKYQILEKSIWLSLSVIAYDLRHYDEQLKREINSTDSATWWLRCTSDIFVALKNLNDLLSRSSKLSGFKESTDLLAKTKLLHRRVDFVNHVRNRFGGHLDPVVTERAAQWAPEIFYADANRETLVFLSYRALLEASINSFLTPDGQQKLFNHEIDLLYPPDRKEFFEFLGSVVIDSLDWINHALRFLDSVIIRHDSTKIAELACIAGQTNFDLRSESDFSYDPQALNSAVEQAITEFKKEGNKDVANGLESLKSRLIKLDS
ncbi:hypothetical protein [Pseudomonas promysalinigenes]|uniref:hypothetical protein n=1 Tax=Pseudomonas promysalinigenes TaxID=485898 RepID=UPI00164727BD|nr:hypothetical protein [Pseudomonas promysalinigenes]QXI32141.1 hypothetical protein HU725_013900 [Pseudomonas promysalinigenes]